MFSADLTKNGTSIPELVKRVREIAELTEPGDVVWCGGSDGEWELLTSVLVENGTFTRLNPELRPNSFYCASDPSDVARVEDRTFICSEREENAGPTNNWIAPDGLRETFAEIFDGCMRGRTMYVIPFCMGPLGSSIARLGVEITDSPYVAVSRRIMTRMGTPALRAIEETGSSVRAVHSVGAPLERGQADVPWPCNPVKYISHFPETREIWSYGSGYGGNALLGKKCYALRIDGKGRDWTPDSPEPAAHPNARFTNPGRPVPDHRAAVGLPPRACRSRRSCSAAGGPAPVPLVIDPFAMLPFCGYNMGDYFGYWLRLDRTAADPAKLPRLFYVNWFRKNASGKFVWPGFGENIRVLKWIIQRLSGEAAAVTTPIGYLPAPGSLDPGGLDISWADLELLLTVDTGAWKLEAEHIPEFFRTFGRHLPEQLWELHQELVDRLG